MRARKLALSAAGLALALGVSAPARAQSVLLDAQAGYFDMLGAKNTLKAITDSAGGVTFGGRLSYVLRKGFFFSAGARYFSKDGQRVFVADPAGPVFKLGHPLKMRVVPAELTAGYRFKPWGQASIYVGLGGGVASYHQESTVGGLTEKDDKTKASGHALTGVEFGRSRVRLGVEASYSVVPSTIGKDAGSVAKVYGESDVGGLSVLGRIAIRLTGK